MSEGTRVIDVEVTKTGTTEYFYILSVEYQHKLAEPVREYVPGGYSVRSHETGSAYRAGTLSYASDEKVTRMELFSRVLQMVLDATNRARRNDGYTVMFELPDVKVTMFDCGRNEL